MAYRALIMDNDINYLSALQNKFITRGFEVIIHDCAGQFENLQRFIKSAKMDLIISDLNFYKINPYDIISFVKSEIDYHYAPYFVYTFRNDEITIDKCNNLGVNYFFSKEDINIDDLIDKVVRILSNLKISQFKN